jgi:hypothetical protein
VLSDYVYQQRSRCRLQTIIGASLLDDFTEWLVGQRYTKSTVRSYLFGVAHFLAWARTKGDRDFSVLGQICLTTYRVHLIESRSGRPRAHQFCNSFCSARTFVRFLRQTGVVPAERDDIPPLVGRFGNWMRGHRGSRESTLANYRFANFYSGSAASLARTPQRNLGHSFWRNHVAAAIAKPKLT